MIEVLCQSVCPSSHHDISIVIDQTNREENDDELPLVGLKAFILLNIDNSTIRMAFEFEYQACVRVVRVTNLRESFFRLLDFLIEL